MNRMALVIKALIVLMLAASAAEADIYRYIDDNGVVCYTDAPLNRKAEKIMRTGPSVGQNSPSAPQKNTQTYSHQRDFTGIVADKATKYAIDPSLVHAVIKTESNGNPYAVSKKGAMGLMQLMPMTANDLQVSNPFDPEDNIDGGTKYLKYLIDKFKGDLTLALAAYNAGPKLVEKRRAVPEISETKQYVKKVLSLYNGKTSHPVPSNQTVAANPERIYKIVAEDGSVLFTNTPHYKKNPRF
ncbi:MAG TPA: lytic transglycosylase domain-containing protein [Thermodesulfovibrionales bacterium]|nr:lytic transglycosylase domain-containing protein [Thermodesulfovibrionales bacterium]